MSGKEQKPQNALSVQPLNSMGSILSTGTGELLIVSEEGNDKSQQYSLEEHPREAMQIKQDKNNRQWEQLGCQHPNVKEIKVRTEWWKRRKREQWQRLMSNCMWGKATTSYMISSYLNPNCFTVSFRLLLELFLIQLTRPKIYKEFTYLKHSP